MQNVKVRCSDTVKKNGDINSLRIKIKLLFMGTDSFLFCPHHSCCTWNLLRCCTCSTVSHRQQYCSPPWDLCSQKLPSWCHIEQLLQKHMILRPVLISGNSASSHPLSVFTFWFEYYLLLSVLISKLLGT